MNARTTMSVTALAVAVVAICVRIYTQASSRVEQPVPCAASCVAAGSQPAAECPIARAAEEGCLYRTRERVSTEPGSTSAQVPVVDESKCVGCGKCVRIAPGVFQIDAKTGKAKVVDPDGADRHTIQRAIDNCPFDALSWSRPK